MNIRILKQFLASRPRRVVGSDGLVPAAVMLPLVLNGTIHVLLTQRSSTLRHHAGEMSFPGGKVDPDDGSRLHTALRETREEIGIAEDEIEIVGTLDDTLSVTNFHITPYAGIIPHRAHYDFNRREIDAVHLVPLAFFNSPPAREIYSSGSREKAHYVYMYEGCRIFGATAYILKNFMSLLDQSGFIAANKELVF